MKKILRTVITACLICFTSVSATVANETTKEAAIPLKMQPGTVMIYDQNLNPVIISGGYLESSDENINSDDITFDDFLCEIPNNVDEAEKRQIELENNIINELHKEIVAGKGSKSDNKFKIYPDMKVVYDENTGDINNIYYVDENEPSGYSIHEPDNDIESSNKCIFP